MYKEWKSIAEEKPIINCGLLLKIIPKDPKHDYRDNIADDLYFYGYLNDTEYVFINAAINRKSEMTHMSWKATKEFDLDEIYWLYDIQFSSEASWNQPGYDPKKEDETSKAIADYYGTRIEIKKSKPSTQ